jgi:dTDP-4-dehydrorhamnose reductase
MKVLVTGSNGLLGQKLSDLLLKENVDFMATGQGDNRYPKKMNYQSMDITNLEDYSVIEDYKPSVIINTAAMTNVDLCESENKACMELNVHSVEKLVSVANKIGAQLIHLSTDFIFDGKKSMYTEDDKPNPLSFYGNSKYLAEQYIIQNSHNYSIVRTVLVYGIVADMSRTNIVLWAKGALEKQQEIKVVNDQFRTPTLAEDLAMGCYLIAQQKANGIFHIAGKDYMSIYELVQRVAKHYGLSTDCMTASDSTTLNQPAKRPPITGLDISKAIKQLGYAPHSFEQGLALLDLQMKENS